MNVDWVGIIFNSAPFRFSLYVLITIAVLGFPMILICETRLDLKAGKLNVSDKIANIIQYLMLCILSIYCAYKNHLDFQSLYMTYIWIDVITFIWIFDLIINFSYLIKELRSNFK